MRSVVISKESISSQKGFNTRPPLISKKKLETFLCLRDAGSASLNRAKNNIADETPSSMVSDVMKNGDFCRKIAVTYDLEPEMARNGPKTSEFL